VGNRSVRSQANRPAKFSGQQKSPPFVETCGL
jgi:hypothetical protein